MSSAIRLDDSDDEEIDFEALKPSSPLPLPPQPQPQPLSVIVAPRESSDDDEEGEVADVDDDDDGDSKTPIRRVLQKPERPKRMVEKQPAVFPAIEAARQFYRKAHDAKAAIAAEQHVDGHIYARAARIARAAYEKGLPRATFVAPFLPAVPPEQLQYALSRRLPRGYYCNVRISKKGFEIEVGGWAT